MVNSPTNMALADSIMHLLHRACQVADSIFNDEAGGIGLTTRQLAVLVAVDENRDVSQTGLVSATGIDRSTVAEIVKRLLKRGLIRRRRSRRDARTYAVRLTDEGQKLLLSVKPALVRAEARLVAGLDGARHVQLSQALHCLIEASPDSR